MGLYKFHGSAHIYIPDQDLFIISHGNNHNLVVIDNKGNAVKEFYAGSEFIEDIEPISNDVNKFISEQETRDCEIRKGLYANVKYNQFKKLYYRFAVLPIPDSKREKFKFGELTSIIILDENFNKLGEQLIPGGYNQALSFIDEKGLNMFNKNRFLETGGDTLTFDTFTEHILSEVK